MKKRFIILILIILILIPIVLLYFGYTSKAGSQKADIEIDTKKVIGPLTQSWKALAQGGEGKNLNILRSVVPQLQDLKPLYIRLDHIYDFYNVASRGQDGTLQFYWTRLDQVVCDIYDSGARPFFSLSYMPPTVSFDGTLIGRPKDWNEWALIVQKTIERYSGKSFIACKKTQDPDKFSDVYYEVWNEPDLETFGKWSLYGGDKSYLNLYYYASLGASRAQNVNNFFLGGPATTGPYRTWFQRLVNFAHNNNLKLDFISWHKYSKSPDDYGTAISDINSWVTGDEIQRIISEWGYDSNQNPIADTNVGAAYTIAAVRKLADQRINLAFNFEIKDVSGPSWGILAADGTPKPRYDALKLLNLLEGDRLEVAGEGTYVSALATNLPRKKAVVLVNYDVENKNNELVPVTFDNLDNGFYQLIISYLGGKTVNFNDISVENNQLKRSILMQPNSVLALELVKI